LGDLLGDGRIQPGPFDEAQLDERFSEK